MAPMMIPGLFSIYPQAPAPQQPQQVSQSALPATTSPDLGVYQQAFPQELAPDPTSTVSHAAHPASETLLTQLIQQLPTQNGHVPQRQTESHPPVDSTLSQQERDVEIAAHSSEKEEGELSEGQGGPIVDAETDASRHNATAIPIDYNVITEVKGPNFRVERNERRRLRRLAKEEAQMAQSADVSKHQRRDLTGERNKAKNFILAWTRNGYSFTQLVQEGLDPHFLRPIYDELGITTETVATKTQANGLEGAANGAGTHRPLAVNTGKSRERANEPPPQPKPVASVVNGSPAAAAKASNSLAEVSQSPKPVVTDRKEYIAKLLAAKVKRSTNAAQDGVAKGVIDLTQSDRDSGAIANDKTLGDDSTVDQSLTAARPGPVVINTTGGTNVSTTGESALIAAKRRAQTELARLRLQALASARAANAAKLSSAVDMPSNATPAGEAPRELPSAQLETPLHQTDVESTSPSEEGEIQDSPDETLVVNQNGDAAEHVETQPSQIPDLALRLSAGPSSDHITSDDKLVSPMAVRPSLPAFVDPTRAQHRKRPVASDFDGGPPTKLAKRPFGDMPGTPSFEDSMVIEVSDDESVDGMTVSKRSALHIDQSNNMDIDTEYDAQVEAAKKEEQLNAKRREADIEKMKRRIAELEAKRKAKAALASRPSTPATPLTIETSSAIPSAAQSPTSRPPVLSSERATANTESRRVIDLTGITDSAPNESLLPQTDSRSTSADTTQRRHEIHRRLPQLEANRATSQSRLAVLKAQMEALQAEMQKEQQEKATLVAELEAFGIDTENMPHAELQAFKKTMDTQDHEASEASSNDAVKKSTAEGRRLYIGNLAYGATEEELKELFNDYQIESTSIPVNPRTAKPVGYAFVIVSTASEAQRALTELNGKMLLGRKLSVQLGKKADTPDSDRTHGKGTSDNAKHELISSNATEHIAVVDEQQVDSHSERSVFLDGSIDDTPVEPVTHEDTNTGGTDVNAPLATADTGPDASEGSESGEIVSNTALSVSSDHHLDIIEDVASSEAHLATHLKKQGPSAADHGRNGTSTSTLVTPTKHVHTSVDIPDPVAHLLAGKKTSDNRVYLTFPHHLGTTSAIEKLFEDFPVSNICVFRHPETKRPLGRAYVTLGNETQALRAVAQLDRAKLNGKGSVTIRLERDIKKKERDRVRNLVARLSISDFVNDPDVSERDYTEKQGAKQNTKLRLAPAKENSPLLLAPASKLDPTLSALFSYGAAQSNPLSLPAVLNGPAAIASGDIEDKQSTSGDLVNFEGVADRESSPVSSVLEPELETSEVASPRVAEEVQGSPAQHDDQHSSSQHAQAVAMQSELSSAAITPVNLDALASDDSAMDIDSESDYEPPEVNAPTPRSIATNGTEPIPYIATAELPIDNSLPRTRHDEPSEISKADNSHFTPYVSPLTVFKAYRHHPSYATDVAGGIRSATYSNRIDAEKQFCPFELAGGVCNDLTCQYQHFKDTIANDEEIIRQLGAANIGRTDEERQRYRQGLVDTIKRIRAQGITEPSAVTSSLMEYRRDFLDDPSKVLSLNVDV